MWVHDGYDMLPACEVREWYRSKVLSALRAERKAQRLRDRNPEWYRDLGQDEHEDLDVDEDAV